MPLIVWFNQITLTDLPLVGGKNASLGHMIATLKDIPIPQGFAVTTTAYWQHLDAHNLRAPIAHLLASLGAHPSTAQVQRVSRRIRALITSQPLPPAVADAIATAYRQLGATAVAVRSSATAEDLPRASFAGLHESFLNIRGTPAVLDACRACFASLFTARAMVYRSAHHIAHDTVALSVGIQRMINSERTCAGVAFTLDPESGFREVVTINASYGLGESVVKGSVTPDTFFVHKPRLQAGFKPLLSTRIGSKKSKLVYRARAGTKKVAVPAKHRTRLCLSERDVLHLARLCVAIECNYSAHYGTWTPMDIEWAQDTDKKIYIVQARPETIHKKSAVTHTVYQLTAPAKTKPLTCGQAIGQQIVSGRARRLESPHQGTRLKAGDIIVTHMTNPDWVPLLKKAGGLITDVGGRTCHAAIVSRELGIPAIIGTQQATHAIADNTIITLDCSQGETGYVYHAKLPFTTKIIPLTRHTHAPIKIMLNIAQPDKAFAQAALPVDGVGLARTEFIIANTIKIHPLALLSPQHTNRAIRAYINSVSAAYANPRQYFVQTLAQEISTIAAAFWPKPVFVRLSDFKSNEYRQLIGGQFFEPLEQNPMLGLRGTARYCSAHYAHAFALECAALKHAREHKGFTNIAVMVPFVRTLAELEIVTTLLAKHGLKRSKTLPYIMMCELPANALLIEACARFVDGFSIGSNDLTQCTLGVDRDEPAVAHLFDEQNPAVKKLISMAIRGAHRAHKSISICGQAPSDSPAFARWIIAQGIDAISLNADAVIPLLLRYR